MGSCCSTSVTNCELNEIERAYSKVCMSMRASGINTLYSGVVWEEVLSQRYYALEEIESMKDRINWRYVSMYQKLTIEFITKYKNRIDFEYLSRNKHLTEEIIREFIEDLALHRVLATMKYTSDKLLFEIINNISHSDLCHALERGAFCDNALEMLDIKTYKDLISRYQRPSESFMIKYQEDLNWKLISRYQKLSLAFIEERPELIDWNELSYSKHLTFDVVTKNRFKLKNTEEVENALKK